MGELSEGIPTNMRSAEFDGYDDGPTPLVCTRHGDDPDDDCLWCVLLGQPDDDWHVETDGGGEVTDGE